MNAARKVIEQLAEASPISGADPLSLVGSKSENWVLEGEPQMLFENSAADTKKYLDLEAAACLLETSANALYKRLRRHGAEIIQHQRHGRIYMTRELLEQYMSGGLRKLKRTGASGVFRKR